MLLETALADFSCDESRGLAPPGTIPFSWEAMLGKPRSPPQSECSGDLSTASSPDVTIQPKHHLHHRHRHDHQQHDLYNSGGSSSSRHYSVEPLAKTLHRQYSGELLPRSRKSPQSRQSSPAADSRPPPSHGGRTFGKSSSSNQLLDLLGHHRGSASTSTSTHSHSTTQSEYHRRTLSSAADENSRRHGNHMAYAGDAGIAPLEWESQPGGRPQSSSSSSSSGDAYRAGSRNGGAISMQPLQLPPSRLMLIKESDQAECSNSSSPGSHRSRSGPFSPEGGGGGGSSSSRRHHAVPKQGRFSGPLSPQQQQHMPMQHHLKVYPGDIIRISRMGSFEASNHHSRHDSYGSVESEEKFYEDESPVSTLERLPSPVGGLHDDHSSHHEYPGDTPRRGSAARPNSSASASPLTDTRISLDSSACSSSRATASGATLRCLPSFHSASLHSSAPAASTSSSSNFMASCLVALEVVLRSDREDEDEDEEQERELEDDADDATSDRHDDSFVSLESGEHPDHLRGARFARSPVRAQSHGHDSELRRRETSHRWSGSRSQLEPEYHTMDFYSENGDDRYKLSSASSRSFSVGRTSTDATSSPQSLVSTLSQLSRPRGRRHRSSDPRRSLDEYSWKDRRFLQDHPSSWVEEDEDEEQGGGFRSSNVSSDCNMSLAGRLQDVFWDDQQSDMNSERAEEVVRGAVDGLRFTYSPVSSAFVFTRPPNSQSSQFENGELPENRVICYSPPNTVDTEISQRFSISLDYATSICSEDSLPYSIARSSDVTELGISRAESWSKIARGASAVSLAQHYHRDSASGLLDRRAGYGVVVVEDSGAAFYDAPEADPLDASRPEPVVRKRPTKKSGLATCLPFRSILRNFKAFSPGRSRLGPQCECNKQQSPMNWTPAQTAVSH
ncbi:hypothetical protein MPTK1_8g07000 [Marchantia polymorpha subsp. ruderalis]|uniref:Uncharacterized protein n=1 Tax=Marchantia polymorpha TaxID=3197 RepID=A0A2R6XII1_MARPO|nr:hypothetical protein MARPO_0013s0092 [Marchantia polymorpha]BBN18980.1 hypothetical protein Mp_8g07000 [Marchantia polymorpha subsp. ruderalis]|eukprot:PTQ45866.1 hypothetical protein MARPO_0013s0092 [Marchantia polymorpha]